MKLAKLAGGIALVAGAAGAVYNHVAGVGSASSSATSLETSPEEVEDTGDFFEVETEDELTISLKVETDYTDRGDDPPAVDYPWVTYLAEPYRPMRVSPGGDDVDDYDYEIYKGDNLVGSTSATVTCYDPQQYITVTINKLRKDSRTLVASQEFDLTCKYVRREIRSLTEDDRTRFFDAMEVLYRTDTETGRAKYGAQYKAAEDFTLVHNTLAGHGDCDHLHGGLGFLPQHAAMSYSFERSLQAVDPMMALPYWDYTIEGHAMTLKNDSIDAWYDSPVWEDDWFGEVSPNGYAISRGRFAFIPVRSDAWKFSSVTNSYGLLRSPWNNNKIPYVCRHHKSYGFYTKTSIVPTCFSHYDQINMGIFQQFGSSIQYAPHGSLHILVGGTFGADYRFYLQNNQNYQERRAQPLNTVTMARTWREGWMSCPEYCSIDTPVQECKCQCPDMEFWIHKNLTMDMLSSMYPSLASAKHFLMDDDGNDISEFFLRMLCNHAPTLNPQIGDFMESASPGDPIFWPTHPTLDRLWAWRKINGFQDESWILSSCTGHNLNDTTVWHIGQDEREEEHYTNRELMDIFDPTLESVPYVYDNFMWPHCADEGYPIQLVAEMPELPVDGLPPQDGTLSDDLGVSGTSTFGADDDEPSDADGTDPEADSEGFPDSPDMDGPVGDDDFLVLGANPLEATRGDNNDLGDEDKNAASAAASESTLEAQFMMEPSEYTKQNHQLATDEDYLFLGWQVSSRSRAFKVNDPPVGLMRRD